MTTHLEETVKTHHVYVQDGVVVLEDFREQDADVVAFVRDADDKELAVHHCLEMGARALKLAGATLDTQLVEHRFEQMTTELGHSITGFAHEIDETTEKLLGDDAGMLKTALESWLLEVTNTLGATFDEKSKTSAIAKLETVLETARKEQVKSVRALLDPENDESPLAGWRREIVKTVKDTGEALEDAIDDLREQLAIDAACAEEAEHGTRKGFTYEEIVADQVTEIVRHLEDTVVQTGTTTGDAGSKVGDLVVQIDPCATPGRAVRYTFEAKDRKLTQANALAELDEAIANRGATVGIMVFSRQANCPVKTPFQWFDHKAFVVLDKDDLDTNALRLACLWARWMCLREETTDANAIDTARIIGLIEAARSTLAGARNIRSGHTQAKKAIDQAAAKLDDLVAGVTATLDELEQVIGEVE